MNSSREEKAVFYRAHFIAWMIRQLATSIGMFTMDASTGTAESCGWLCVFVHSEGLRVLKHHGWRQYRAISCNALFALKQERCRLCARYRYSPYIRQLPHRCTAQLDDKMAPCALASTAGQQLVMHGKSAASGVLAFVPITCEADDAAAERLLAGVGAGGFFVARWGGASLCGLPKRRARSCRAGHLQRGVPPFCSDCCSASAPPGTVCGAHACRTGCLT